MENPGLYIHIPFCRRKCAYCAFYSVASFDAGKTASYLQALLAEARWFASHRFHDAKPKIRTVYIGGGTPSILPVSFYSALFEGLESCFDFSGCIEWSFEANPEHLGQAYLSELWKNTPIRRLSIGLQSFRDEDLHVLKRWHTGREAVEAIGMARNAGFKNLSVDLMYGLWQEKGLRHWKENLMKLAELDVPHFSAYALTLEPGTLLWKRVKQGMAHMAPDEEIEEEAKKNLLGRLPEEMRDIYADLMTYDGSYEYRLMKQADKICAYLKCVEERKAGSKEFLSAERSILKELEETALPETALFMSRFLPSYELTLDETEKI